MPARFRPAPQFQPPPVLVDLTSDQMQTAWANLADLSAAPTTIQLLASGKQTVSFLAEHMKPGVAPSDPTKIDRLIEDLQSTRFVTRQAATIELEKAGPAAEPALLKVLESKPPLEVSRRIEAILARFPILQAQFHNGLQALALHASPDALALLATLSRGHATAWQTKEAAAACEMMRTASWHMVVYGPLQAQAEFQQQLLKTYWDDLKKRPPNAR